MFHIDQVRLTFNGDQNPYKDDSKKKKKPKTTKILKMFFVFCLFGTRLSTQIVIY